MALTIAINERESSPQTSANTRYQLEEIRGNISAITNNWLQTAVIPNSDDEVYQVKLLDSNQHGKVVSQAIIRPAEKSLLQGQAQLKEDSLNTTALIEAIEFDAKSPDNELIATTLYLSLRRSRILGRENIICLVPELTHPIVNMLKLEALPKANKITINGKAYIAVAQRLKYAMHQIYKHIKGELLDTVTVNIKHEVLETVDIWLERFFNGSWALAIRQHTLSKQQYIYSLFNLHQYARQTTQHLGRCVSLAPTIALRNHFIDQLRSEVNHELIIENDLRHLGADVEYLKYIHTPHHATKEFMVVQESTIGFYQDTILMLACPLAVEGMTSYITPDFLQDLYQTIASWGIEKPRAAAMFLTSHVNTDGGIDGHWVNVVKLIEQYIKTEDDLQRFLSVANSAMISFERGFNVIIDDMKLWAA